MLACASGIMARILSRLAGSSGSVTPPGTTHPGWMRLSPSNSMMLWPKRRRADTGAAKFRLGGGDAEECCALRVGFHAQKQIGRGEIEEAERVRLHHLRQVQHAAQLRGGVRNAHRHDGFAGLGGRDEMRDGADAADARHETGHLVERTAFVKCSKPRTCVTWKCASSTSPWPLSWMVILPWPSRRVTGSMVMVWLIKLQILNRCRTLARQPS